MRRNPTIAPTLIIAMLPPLSLLPLVLPIHNRQVCYRSVTDLLCLLYICYRAVTDQQSFHRSVVYLSLYCR